MDRYKVYWVRCRVHGNYPPWISNFRNSLLYENKSHAISNLERKVACPPILMPLFFYIFSIYIFIRVMWIYWQVLIGTQRDILFKTICFETIFESSQLVSGEKLVRLVYKPQSLVSLEFSEYLLSAMTSTEENNRVDMNSSLVKIVILI